MKRQLTQRRMAVAGVALAIALGTTACPGNVHHTYKTFQSAVDRGASCSELFDQRGRFSKSEDLTRIDGELQRIGCTSRDSVRSAG